MTGLPHAPAPRREFRIDDDIEFSCRTLPQVWKVRRDMGDGPFFWFAGKGELSVIDFDRLCQRAYHAFRAREIEKGDRVVLFTENSPEMLALMLGAWRAGAIVVPISAQAQGAVLRDQIKRSNRKLLISDLAVQVDIAELGVEDSLSVEDFLNVEAQEDATSNRSTAPGPLDTALILFTSGSTGPSKGCVMSHHMCTYYAWVFWRYMGFGPQDTVYSCLPYNHVHALFASFFPAVMAGAKFASSKRFSPSRYWHEISESRATACSAIGPIASIMIDREPEEVEKRLHVRIAHVAPPPPNLAEYESRFNLRVVSSLYGMTEAMVFPPDVDGPSVLGRLGEKPQDWDIGILDNQGQPVIPGETGEICLRPLRAGIIFDSYDGMPTETLKAWRGLWHHTGDIGRIDRQGVYWFTGRTADRIRRNGHNISAWEMEQIIVEHPLVADVATIGIDESLDNTKVVVVARPKSGTQLLESELQDYCAQKLPKYMMPDQILVVADQFPRTQSGKVDRNAIRSIVAGRGQFNPRVP